MKLTVQAQIGDKTWFDDRAVTHRPSAGVKTPRGKVDIGLDGYKVTWGARTEIEIERAEQ